MANNQNKGFGFGGKQAIILIGACLIIALMVGLTGGVTQPFAHGKKAYKVEKGQLIPGQLSTEVCQGMMKEYAINYAANLAKKAESARKEGKAENIQLLDLNNLSVADAGTILEKFFDTPESCQCETIMRKPMSTTIQSLRDSLKN